MYEPFLDTGREREDAYPYEQFGLWYLLNV